MHLPLIKFVMDELPRAEYNTSAFNTPRYGRCLRIQIQTQVQDLLLKSNKILGNFSCGMAFYGLKILSLQVTVSDSIWIKLDTLGEQIALYVGHPGDEILGLFGHSVYKTPKPIRIEPTSEVTEVNLVLKANEKEWNLQTSLKGLTL